MPYENGKLNWWALAAIITPVVMSLVLALFWQLRDSDRELFRTLIVQNSKQIERHNDQQREIINELKEINKKQDDRLSVIEDTVKTICWAIAMPYQQRMEKFIIPYMKNHEGKKP